ncbi:hypothetical protein QBC40DRAFT_214170 [Triangularia verruculosa]|uniref:Uncharacterized protein n=1 Tax=Triangularia verruculosa TaxID=2587418 RepID=A0AAN6XA79_9PEZI|nr:hypothetical protein QBC40DRAFT_214170 [Triangularia verruculosa]
MTSKLIPNNTKDAGEDNSYVSRPGHKHEPMQVVPDEEAMNEVDHNQRQRAKTSSDNQLERDEREAIDKSNIIPNGNGNKPNTRGAAPPKGAYKEPGDTEGLPKNDGRSSM